MRDDDDTLRLYTPVFWRIIILVAIIAAVPVVLWTITSFMRTYVAQPKTPTFRPIAVASSSATPGDTTGSVSAAADADTAADASPATANMRTASIDPKGTYLGGRLGNAAGAQDPVPAPSGEVGAAPQPASPWPAAALQSQAPAADSGSLDDLLPSRPIKGPVPLPPRRPHIAQAAPAVAAASPAATAATPRVPMPRARPASAPAPQPFNPDDAPFSRARQDSLQQ